MTNFCEANEDYFVRSLVTDRPIKRPTVSQGLTGSRQSVLSKKKKMGALCGLHYSQGQSEGGKEWGRGRLNRRIAAEVEHGARKQGWERDNGDITGKAAGVTPDPRERLRRNSEFVESKWTSLPPVLALPLIIHSVFVRQLSTDKRSPRRPLQPPLRRPCSQAEH